MIDPSNFRRVTLPPAIAEGASFVQPIVRPLGWTDKQLEWWQRDRRLKYNVISRGRHTVAPAKRG